MTRSEEQDAEEPTLASADTELAPTRQTAEQTTAPASRAMAAGGPTAGETWARYVVLEPLGAGGMGSVWAAYDPELERKVALKVLHDEWLGRANQERLRREAKAMARLAHPNVVPVFDVGEHAGRSFYTMELVRGRSVREWARTKRSWREVQRVFVDAARGLAAIHGAGLVHRDVKPANLLLGDDGRARIADLGIATVAPDTPPGDALEASFVGGTPAYMAPEQHGSALGDAASDQFAFGVSLWEALHGHAPFAGDTAEARVRAMAGEPRVSDREVPSWLDAAVRRTLALDPAVRFPDVATLARGLDGPRARRWPIVVGGGAAAAAIAGIAVLAFGGHAPIAAIDPCAAAGSELDLAWHPARAAAQRARLAAERWLDDPLPTAMAGALDARVVEWRSSARDACRRDASRAWSSELAARAAHCLDRRRREITLASDAPDPRAFTDRLGRVVRATRCLDPAFLQAQLEPPADPITAAIADSATTLLSIVRTSLSAGVEVHPPLLAMQFQATNWVAQVAVTGRVLDALGTLPDTLGDPSLRFLAAATRIDQQITQLDWDLGVQGAAHAYEVARAAGDLEDADHELGFLLETALSADEVTRWRTTARFDLDHEPEVAAAPAVLARLADLELAGDEPDAAFADAQRALELYAKTYGMQHAGYLYTLGMIGHALLAADRAADAAPYFDRQLAEGGAWFGADNRWLAEPLDGLARAESALGHHAHAIALANAALDLYTRSLYGVGFPASFDEGLAYAALGSVLEDAGRHADALIPFARASDILMMIANGGQSRAWIANETAYRLAAVRSFAPADRAARERTLAILRGVADAAEVTGGPDDPEHATANTAIAETLIELGRCAEAEPIAQRAFAIQDRTHHRAGAAAAALELVARCQLERHQLVDAERALRRADQLLVHGEPRQHAGVLDRLVRVELARGQQDLAVSTAYDRRQQLVAGGADAATLAALDAWLDHPKGPPP